MKLKAKELRAMSISEVEEKCKECKDALLHVRQRQHTQTAKPHELYRAKRNVAVAMCVLKEKQMESMVEKKAALGEKIRGCKMTKRRRLALSREQLGRCRNGKSRIYKGTRRVLYAYMPS